MSTSQVTALYANRALSFTLSKDATLADLADHLEQPRIGGWHMDMPTAITLKFAITRSPSAILQAGSDPTNGIAEASAYSQRFCAKALQSRLAKFGQDDK